MKTLFKTVLIIAFVLPTLSTAQEIDFTKLANLVFDKYSSSDIVNLKKMAASSSVGKQQMVQILHYQNLIEKRKKEVIDFNAFEDKTFRETNKKLKELNEEIQRNNKKLKSLDSKINSYEREKNMHLRNYKIAVTMKNQSAANKNYADYKTALRLYNKYINEYNSIDPKNKVISKEFDRLKNKYLAIKNKAKSKSKSYTDIMMIYPRKRNNLIKEFKKRFFAFRNSSVDTNSTLKTKNLMQKVLKKIYSKNNIRIGIKKLWLSGTTKGEIKLESKTASYTLLPEITFSKNKYNLTYNIIDYGLKYPKIYDGNKLYSVSHEDEVIYASKVHNKLEDIIGENDLENADLERVLILLFVDNENIFKYLNFTLDIRDGNLQYIKVESKKSQGTYLISINIDNLQITSVTNYWSGSNVNKSFGLLIDSYKTNLSLPSNYFSIDKYSNYSLDD